MARERNFGVAVDAPRCAVVVERGRLFAENVANGEHAFGERDVGELWRVHEIADRPHTGFGGATALVDLDKASLIDTDRRALEAEQIGEGAAPDRHDDGVDFDRLTVAEVNRGARPIGLRGMAVDHHARARRDATLLERPLDDLGGVDITAVEDLGQCLEDRDLGAEVAHHRRELTADRPTTDDDGGSGKLRHRENFVGGHDHRTVDVEAGDRAGHRTGCEDHGLALQGEIPRLASAHGDGAIGAE